MTERDPYSVDFERLELELDLASTSERIIKEETARARGLLTQEINAASSLVQQIGMFTTRQYHRVPWTGDGSGMWLEVFTLPQGHLNGPNEERQHLRVVTNFKPSPISYPMSVKTEDYKLSFLYQGVTVKRDNIVLKDDDAMYTADGPILWKSDSGWTIPYSHQTYKQTEAGGLDSNSLEAIYDQRETLKALSGLLYQLSHKSYLNEEFDPWTESR